MYCDMQNVSPVELCKSCGGEIYSGEYVYDLFPVLTGKSHVIHVDCLCDCLESHKNQVIDYIFDDLSILEDVFDGLLDKNLMMNVIDDWSDDCEFE